MSMFMHACLTTCLLPELTLSSVMTRTKPNAFTHLHQLNKKSALGERLDDLITQWLNVRVAREVYGMGPTEAQAVVNLFRGIPPVALDMLQTSVAKFGMVRGPITHQALACKAVCIGFCPDVVSPDWRSRSWGGWRRVSTGGGCQT